MAVHKDTGKTGGKKYNPHSQGANFSNNGIAIMYGYKSKSLYDGIGIPENSTGARL